MNAKLLIKGLFLTGCMAFASCIDSNFDLSDVDATVGVGTESLTLPGNNSTTEILLDDVLDLDNSDFITTTESGDYVLRKNGGDVSPTTVSVNSVDVEQSGTQNFDLQFTLPADIPALPNLPDVVVPVEIEPITEAMDVKVFEYEGRHTDDVQEIVTAEVDSEIDLLVEFSPALTTTVPTMDYMSVQLPPYIVLGDFEVSHEYDRDKLNEENILRFNNLETATPIHIKARVKGLKDFQKEIPADGQYIAFTPDMVKLRGAVHIEASFSKIQLSNIAGQELLIHSELDMGTLSLTKVTGRFNPEINMDNIGNFTINDVPDFLTEEGVVVDIYNPQLRLNIESNVDVAGIVDGVVSAKDKQGNIMAEVAVNDIRINRNAKTSVLICRQQPEQAEDGVQVIVVPELSTLVEKIPHSISFSANAQADASQVCVVEMGKEYEIQPSYSFEAPLAFAENACIVYSDKTDGWNEDLQDIDVMDNTSVEMTATVVNNVPAFLQFTAEPIDKAGNVISSDLLGVEVDGVVDACRETGKSAESALRIKVSQKSPEAIKRLDGVKYTITAKATENGESVTGITLNKQTQTIVIKDINVTLKGKVIADLN